MKKRFYVFSMLAAGMLLAGCSDDLEGGQDGPNVVEGETGYVKIALNLPSAPASNFRANNNDDFEDGIEAEYKVNDVILALFYGTDETSATLGCAYGLSGTWTDDLDDDNVTRYISSVQEIKAPADKQKVYALVIVNGKKSGYFNVSSSNMLQFSADGSSSPSDVGSEFKLASFYNGVNTMNVDLAKIANTSTSDGKEVNFLMLNAPTSNKPAAQSMGSDDTHSVTTLVEVPVWESEAAAESNPATDIYVERAVAKVTVSVDSKDDYSLTVKAGGTTYDGATVTFEGWKLQTTNKSMFAVRNVYAKDANTMMPTTVSYYAWKTWAGFYVNTEICRFFGSAPNPYRVYWGVDPNYFNVVTDIATNFNVYDKDDLTTAGEWNGMNNNVTTSWVAEYCAENTTIAKAMQDNNLTCVLLKAKFELADTENSGINDDLFMINNTSAIYTEKDFIAVATAALTGGNALGNATLTLKGGISSMTITNADNVSDLLQISGGTSPELSSEQEKAILDACGGSIKYYQDGVMYYYTSLIQHFGDVPTKAGTINSLEDYNDKNHLGRYGVLRNNWYELSITSVGGPGEPEIPEVPSEPADATEGYINVAINVLSWAKRQQNVDL